MYHTLSRLAIRPFLLILLTAMFMSCMQEEDMLIPAEEIPAVPPQKSYPGVEKALWPFFESFEEAGKQRNIDVDLVAARLTGVISEIDQEHVAGRCTYYSHRPNHVTIDQEFWDRASEILKEMIIYHELGHCYLGLDHREEKFANGVCKSIMRSGNEDCFDNYNLRTREYYLDELFDVNMLQ